MDEHEEKRKQLIWDQGYRAGFMAAIQILIDRPSSGSWCEISKDALARLRDSGKLDEPETL